MLDDLVLNQSDTAPSARARPPGSARAGIALALTVALGVGWLTARAVLAERPVGPPEPVVGGIDLDVQPATLGRVSGELAPDRPLVRALTVRDTGPLALTYTISYRVRTQGPVDLAPLLHLRMFEVASARACSRLNAGAGATDSTTPPATGWAPLVGGAVQADRPQLAAVAGSQVWCLRLELAKDAGASVDGATAEVDLRFDAQQETAS
jgi:hypothetical protein